MVKLVGQRDLEAARKRARPANPSLAFLYRSVTVVGHAWNVERDTSYVKRARWSGLPISRHVSISHRVAERICPSGHEPSCCLPLTPDSYES